MLMLFSMLSTIQKLRKKPGVSTSNPATRRGRRSNYPSIPLPPPDEVGHNGTGSALSGSISNKLYVDFIIFMVYNV